MRIRRWWLVGSVAGGLVLFGVCAARCVHTSSTGSSVVLSDSDVPRDRESSVASLSLASKVNETVFHRDPGAESQVASRSDEILTQIRAMDAKLGPPPVFPAGWKPPVEKPPTPTPTLPALQPGDGPRDLLAQATRWFESLPRGKETSREQMDASRARLAKTGVELLGKECRAGVCWMSFSHADDPSRKRTKDAAHIREQSWSFSIALPDGKTESHMFVVRP